MTQSILMEKVILLYVRQKKGHLLNKKKIFQGEGGNATINFLRNSCL